MAGTFAELVGAGRAGDALDAAFRSAIEDAGADATLAREIGHARLLLLRVMSEDGLTGDPHRLARTVASLVEQITGLMRARRAVVGDTVDELAAAVDTLLDEMGLGA